MKKHIIGLILGALALTVGAQETAAPAASAAASAAETSTPVGSVSAPAESALPDGVVTETHPLKRAYLDKNKSTLAVFRPNPSMPEVTNEDLLRGMSETGKTPGKASQVIGYLPKLKVLPCAKGCSGSDYERAVAEFIKGYRGEGKHFEERGEMVVQVRWFNVRPFLMRQLPYGADLFGVSFILEGKLVSLGRSSGVGISVGAHELARDMGAQLAVNLAYNMGMGARASFLTTLDPTALGGLADGLSAVNTKVSGALGVEDVRSRIEPVTDAHKQLLPAIDGINPGEVKPVSEVRYIGAMIF